VHLAALRYLLLFEAMLRGGQLSYGEIRDRESGRLQTLTYVHNLCASQCKLTKRVRQPLPIDLQGL
jgi:hypothetical protein